MVAVPAFCSPNRPCSFQMTTGLIMAFQLRSRAQIFSHYLSSRRVTEKFRCSTCLLRTPHCVTVNSSRLYEHPRHNRVVQHTWTVDISALARLLNTGCFNRSPTNRRCSERRNREETRKSEASHAASTYRLFYHLYLR